MDIEFIEHKGAYPSNNKFTQAYQVVSLEDPYHPQDVGFASTYEMAYEMAEKHDEEHDTSTWGMGMRIYEILILG